VLWAGQLKQSEVARVPDADYVHVYIARGSVTLQGAGTLNEGDAVRLTGAGALSLTASPLTGAEVLIWEMGAGIDP
jgi:hypothetical protein